MSDTLIMALIVGAYAAVNLLLTGWTERKKAAQKALIDAAAAAQNAEIIAAAKILEKNLEDMNKKVDDTNKKVDEYHKETNSKLSQLVVAEKGVSFAEGEKQGKADQIILEKEKQTIVTYDTPKQENPPSTTEAKGIKKDLTQAKEKIDQAKKKLDEI